MGDPQTARAPQRRRASRLALAVALVIGAGLLPAAGTASGAAPSVTAGRSTSPAASCPTDGITGIQLPSGDLATLATDAAAIGTGPAWVVGVRAGKGISRIPWVVRHTADGWKRVAMPALGPDSGLMGVDAASRQRAWAVGFSAVGRVLSPISARWNGSAWSAVRVPSGGGSEALTDVSIARDGTPWAVGYRFGSRGPRPIALRWTGSDWVHQVPGLGTGRFGALAAVDADDPSGPWAAGWQGNGAAPRPLLLHRVDGRWRRVTTGLEGDGELVLTGLDATATGEVVVTGYRQVDQRLTAIVWRLAGDTWTEDPTVAAIAGSLLPDDVTLDAGGWPVLAGGYRGPDERAYTAFLAAETADGWGMARNPEAAQPRGHLRSLLDTDPVLAVGWSSREAVAVTPCGPLPVAPARGSGKRRGGRAGREDAATTGQDGGTRPVADPADRPDAPTVTARRRWSGASLPRPAAPVTLAGITFRDVASQAGIDIVDTSYGATVLDIDADGRPDLAISRHIAHGTVLRNTKGGFVKAAGNPLPVVDRHGCAAADVDGVAGDELFCAIGAARGMRFKTNELWLGLDTSTPTQRASAWGVDDPLARGRRATFVDLDGDPWPDLLVSSDPVRVDGLPSLVRAYRNQDGASFSHAPGLGLELPVSGACAVDADLDGDGSAEIILCTEESWAGLTTGAHVFSRGTGDHFRDATSDLGVRPAGDVDVAVGDLDGDHHADLVQLSPGRLAVNLQRDGHQRRVLSLGVTAGTAVAIGDADGDHHPDIYVVQGGRSGNAPDLLLRNSGDGRSFTSIAIPQLRSGSADDVVVLDFDGNGTDDFLVTNGAAYAGPVQLIAGQR